MKVIITGGAGFIGCNSAEYFSKKGCEVTVVDNLSRKGSPENLKYLQDNFTIDFVKGDVRDVSFMDGEFSSIATGADLILHLAAQVAVTTSVKDPREDFEINAIGTFNVLEALRKIKEEHGKKPFLVYSSTNKVYGGMEDIGITEKEGEYDYENLPQGITEERCLDFHSPYGCSKGCADQYVRDYARIYNLDTVVLRQSCIYGRRQMGVEDQGWVAWFTIAAALKKQISIFGDGKQVRDVLWVEDLIRAYDLAFQNREVTSGKEYNVGGGPENRMSLLKLLEYLNSSHREKIDPIFEDWRPGDQKVCILNIDKAKKDFGWEPEISPKEGVLKLDNWVNKNIDELKNLFN